MEPWQPRASSVRGDGICRDNFSRIRRKALRLGPSACFHRNSGLDIHAGWTCLSKRCRRWKLHTLYWAVFLILSFPGYTGQSIDSSGSGAAHKHTAIRDYESPKAAHAGYPKAVTANGVITASQISDSESVLFLFSCRHLHPTTAKAGNW